MGEVPTSSCFVSPTAQGEHFVGSTTSMTVKKRQRDMLGGPMNNEEIKMNRQMLNEISDLKKTLGEKYHSPNRMN